MNRAISAMADLPSPEVLFNDTALAHVPGAVRTREPISVHRKLPGYRPTPLVRCDAIAHRLGVADVWVKDESWRLGLPAFKMLGASYAVYHALIERLGHDVAWNDIDELRAQLATLMPMALAAATDGNHGRAVARMAKLLGFPSSIYVPQGMVPARIEAIESEGATVTVVAGDYDAAVRRSAEDAGDYCLVISDTSWPGYVRTPTRVMRGYSTVFAEISDQLAAHGAPEPTMISVPVGVGAFAAAAVHNYKPENAVDATPFLLGVEPGSANCVMQSIRSGELVTVPGPHTSVMVGLNCGTPSEIAWPLVSRGLDAVVAIDDGWARQAMRELAAAGVVSGETGAASLAGLSAVCNGVDGGRLREQIGLGATSSVLVLSTEGATDPDAWAHVVGRAVPQRSRTISIGP